MKMLVNIEVCGEKHTCNAPGIFVGYIDREA